MLQLHNCNKPLHYRAWCRAYQGEIHPLCGSSEPEEHLTIAELHLQQRTFKTVNLEIQLFSILTFSNRRVFYNRPLHISSSTLSAIVRYSMIALCMIEWSKIPFSKIGWSAVDMWRRTDDFWSCSLEITSTNLSG